MNFSFAMRPNAFFHPGKLPFSRKKVRNLLSKTTRLVARTVLPALRILFHDIGVIYKNTICTTYYDVGVIRAGLKRLVSYRIPLPKLHAPRIRISWPKYVPPDIIIPHIPLPHISFPRISIDPSLIGSAYAAFRHRQEEDYRRFENGVRALLQTILPYIPRVPRISMPKYRLPKPVLPNYELPRFELPVLKPPVFRFPGFAVPAWIRSFYASSFMSGILTGCIIELLYLLLAGKI